MKYASVCSGVKAASLGWMPLGWEAAWFSEIERFPCAVLAARFPNIPNLGDMTKIKVELLRLMYGVSYDQNDITVWSTCSAFELFVEFVALAGSAIAIGIDKFINRGL